jgi:predicted O-linked N-acetylglucosamine transferase (SPINDLY family)
VILIFDNINAHFFTLIRVGDSCDLIVDAPIYNSHTTAVDALWAGVPIVAFGNSKHFSGRVCASMLNTLGLQELIAQSYDQVYDMIECIKDL